jgi:O-antigen/teichoic acid export membrane protein
MNSVGLEKKPSKTFLESVVTLAGGSTFSSGLIILIEPITSRMFPPDVFGLTSTFYSAAMILGMLSCLRYEMALVLPREENDAANLFVLCGIILITLTSAIAVITAFWESEISLLLNTRELSGSLYLFPAAVFLIGFDLLLSRWFTRQKLFSRIAFSRTMLAVPRAIAEISGGALGLNSAVNLIGYRLLGLIGPPVVLLERLFRSDVPEIFRNCTLAGILKVAARYKKFPQFESISYLFMVVSLHAPIILLTSYFGASEAGYYAKAFYLLYMPTFLIGQSTSLAFSQLSAHKVSHGEDLSALVEIIFNRLISFAVMPFAMVSIIGPEIFEVVLGKSWIIAGGYAQIISPWLFVVLLHNSVATLFGTLERQQIGMFFNFMLFLRLAILFWGGVSLRDPILTLSLFSLASVIIISGKSFYLIIAAGGTIRKILRHFALQLAVLLPTLVVLSFTKWYLRPSSLTILGMAIVLAILHICHTISNTKELKTILTNRGFWSQDLRNNQNRR